MTNRWPGHGHTSQSRQTNYLRDSGKERSWNTGASNRFHQHEMGKGPISLYSLNRRRCETLIISVVNKSGDPSLLMSPMATLIDENG